MNIIAGFERIDNEHLKEPVYYCAKLNITLCAPMFEKALNYNPFLGGPRVTVIVRDVPYGSRDVLMEVTKGTSGIWSDIISIGKHKDISFRMGVREKIIELLDPKEGVSYYWVSAEPA